MASNTVSSSFPPDDDQADHHEDEKKIEPTSKEAAHIQITSDPWPSASSGLRHRQPPATAKTAATEKSSSALPWPTTNEIMLPSISSSSYEHDFEEDDCPATRAAAAVQVLASQPLDNIMDEHDNSQMGLSTSTIAPFASDATVTNSSLDRWNETLNDNDANANTTGLRSHRTARSSSSTTSSQQYNPEPTTRSGSSNNDNNLYTFSSTFTGRILTSLSSKLVPQQLHSTYGGSAFAGFLALLLVTCANYVLGPMRDAAALAVGVSHIPALTLASTVLALGSSVPVGWLFEAPDPRRRRVWKKMGLTRGETQGTSLALFYRVFGFLLWSYAVGFWMVERGATREEDGVPYAVEDEGEDGDKRVEESIISWIGILSVRIFHELGVPMKNILDGIIDMMGQCFGIPSFLSSALTMYQNESLSSLFLQAFATGVNRFGSIIYIMFFLVVHLMKLHSLSLIWGVTTEAMEYEEAAERRRNVMHNKGDQSSAVNASNEKQNSPSSKNKTTSHSALRLKRLGFVGFGGTLGGIFGSLIASFAAHMLNLSGLLILAASLLEISANLSIELGRIMQRHWEEQMRIASCGDLASLGGSELSLNGAAVDSSMKKSVSLGSMKRIASSQASLAQLNNQTQHTSSNSGKGGMTRAKSIGALSATAEEKAKLEDQENRKIIDENSFKQRLLRGVTTILRSRLLMAIFTYNALYASTSVLLSFQRAELVANRSSHGSSAVSNTAFLAKINTASSVAVFALQASGLGALIANSCGQRGALALMPLVRMSGVILLGWWHWWSRGQPPDLTLFLIIDEFTKVINFAVAKPVRENLWRGLSPEARYEAKPIVDTLANRWGGGSAAFLVSFINKIAPLIGVGVTNEDGQYSIFGFPPVLLLCIVISAWWTAVSADVGNIRRKIDLELKKQQ